MLNVYLSEHLVLPNDQFRFRAAHSAAHQLRRVVKNVKDSRNSIARLTSRITLETRMFQISVGSAKSSSHYIAFGVPQSAILSPTLYNIFTSDVPSFEFCRTVTFADDTTIFASGQIPLLVQHQIQDHPNEVSDYCKDCKQSTFQDDSKNNIPYKKQG
jgi:Reverse transcriptase (RNA-dependent DNA polymerase)